MRKAGGAGYFCLEVGPAVVIGDLAPLGPDHLPAHGHADTLSFEMSLGKKKLFFNGRTSEYGYGRRRQRERGTKAHNTVCLDGVNSSETWDGFRVGRRARVLKRLVADREKRGELDGYKYLPTKHSHQRTWRLTVKKLMLEDQISPPHPKAKAIFRLASGLRLREQAGRWRVLDQYKIVAVMRLFGGTGRVEKTLQAKQFGRLEKAKGLMVEFPGGRLKAEVRW
jgi:hypothetical protein